MRYDEVWMLTQLQVYQVGKEFHETFEKDSDQLMYEMNIVLLLSLHSVYISFSTSNEVIAGGSDKGKER